MGKKPMRCLPARSELGRAALIAGLFASAGISAAARADEGKQRAYGQHLSSECSACHRIDGVDNGIPSITGWPVATFETTMDYYRTGARPNQVMVSVIQSLDEAQIKALALYYGSLPKPVRGAR